MKEDHHNHSKKTKRVDQMKKSILLVFIILLTNLITSSSFAENNTGIQTIQTKKSAYNGVYLKANIVYAKTEIKPLHMHILLPKQKSTPRPLIVFIKGGVMVDPFLQTNTI